MKLICPNLPHSQAIYVKLSKDLIFLLKSFLGNFYRHLATFTGHTDAQSMGVRVDECNVGGSFVIGQDVCGRHRKPINKLFCQFLMIEINNPDLRTHQNMHFRYTLEHTFQIIDCSVPKKTIGFLPSLCSLQTILPLRDNSADHFAGALSALNLGRFMLNMFLNGPILASFCLFSYFHIPFQVTNIQCELYKSKKTQMVCLGLEPGAAKWKAQTNPLSYDGTQYTQYVCAFKFLQFYVTQVLLIIHLMQVSLGRPGLIVSSKNTRIHEINVKGR